MILVFVAAIAAASKYLLAWRGRHIFNPAAAAAVISGIVGLSAASWWVGTSPMMAPVLIGGALVLYKTRRLRMGAYFVLLSFAAFMAVSIMKGYDAGDAWRLLIGSSPVLFLAGFMLSEPLTQPPRRYQRYIFASIVGILAGSQITFGTFLVTPEMALLVGNAYAFLCGQRGGVKLRLVGRRPLSRDQVEYTFQPNRPLRFTAGQYVELHLSHIRPDARGQRRMFTIASAPGEDAIKLGIRHYMPSSTFKKALQTATIGMELPVTGVYGDFILQKNTSDKLLLIAGGIGITPFRAHLEWLLNTGQRRDGILLYSVREPGDAVFQDILMAEAHGVSTHIITGPIDEGTLMQYAPDIAGRHVYVSGPPPMVDAMSQMAKRHGATHIHRDHFNGY